MGRPPSGGVRGSQRAVTSAPALRAIDYASDCPVIMSVDSSIIAIGFILSQEDEEGRRRPARYGSLPINERESWYSQPKLELYGLFRALRHYRLYLIGVKSLNVEVDAKYIKGMLNEPDLQPNATINRWIQGILLFDFKLIHVPAIKFKGPDGLSRREPLEEEREEFDDQFLDEIALLAEYGGPVERNDGEAMGVPHGRVRTGREASADPKVPYFPGNTPRTQQSLTEALY